MSQFRVFHCNVLCEMLTPFDGRKVAGVVYALNRFDPSTTRLGFRFKYSRTRSTCGFPHYHSQTRPHTPQTSFLLYLTMILGRERDHKPSLAVRRRDIIRAALPITARWRQRHVFSFRSIRLRGVAQLYLKRNLQAYANDVHRGGIHTAVFEFKFVQLTGNARSKLFRFRKEDIAMMVRVIVCPTRSTNRQRNRYSQQRCCFNTTPVLSSPLERFGSIISEAWIPALRDFSGRFRAVPGNS